MVRDVLGWQATSQALHTHRERLGGGGGGGEEREVKPNPPPECSAHFSAAVYSSVHNYP